MAFNTEDSSLSFQGQNQRGGKQTQSSRTKCPCGNTSFTHHIAGCWYITKNPKEGWQSKPDVTENVARAMKDPRLNVPFLRRPATGAAHDLVLLFLLMN